MKKYIFLILLVITVNSLLAQAAKTIVLNPPDEDKGFSVLKSLSLRASAAEFDTSSIGLQDLSNLL